MANKIIQTTKITLVVFFIALGWIIFNYGDIGFKAGLGYGFLSLVVFLLLVYFPKAIRYGIETGAQSKLGGDILAGIGFALFFVVWNSVSSAIAIGFPELPQSAFGDKVLITGFVAPIGEELFFRTGVYSVLVNLVGMSPILAVPAQALGFAGYHWSAYGESFRSNNAAFFGAFLFGVAAQIVTIWRNSIVPVIIAHSFFNIYLASLFVFAFLLFFWLPKRIFQARRSYAA